MGDQQPLVFISAVTSELGDERALLANILEQHGANVVVQRAYPSSLSDGYAIQRTIENADLVICLIGHCYGAEFPEGNRPAEADPGCSWTQWEYLYARKHAKELRSFLFTGRKAVAAETESFAARQTEFRDRIEKAAISNFGEKFFRRFETADQIEKDIRQYLQNLDGALAGFRAGTWSNIKDAYRQGRIEAWQKNFPLSYGGSETSADKEKLMAAAAAPFVASQRFSILVPDAQGQQSPHLKPAGFLPGRDSEAEARARADSEWRKVGREQIVAALCRQSGGELAGIAVPQPPRLFLISGGGVGKTTNMRWLEARLNGAAPAGAGAQNGPAGQCDVLAVLVGADKLVAQDDNGVLAALTEKIVKDTQKTADKWSETAIEHGLRQDAEAGKLIVLIDGLDHVESERVRLLTSVQSHLPGRYWSPCALVAAGRPHATLGWEDAPAHTEKTVAAGNWRFIEPAEFEAHEAEIFLGNSEGQSRYKLVDDKLGTLINVPRVLEYVRTLPKRLLANVRTSADIYEKATRELIKRTLNERDSKARMIGPGWQQDHDPDRAVRSEQIDYVMKMLSALAFVSLCRTTDPTFRSARRTTWMMIDAHVKDAIWSRVAPRDTTAGSDSADLKRDLRALAAFAAILGNGLLDATDTDTDTLRTLVWSNRTIHQFLAAYWLAKHAGGFDAWRERLAGKPNAEEADHPNRDTDRFRCYVFYREADQLGTRYEKTDVTYELNQFLAEMPASAVSAESWVAAAAAWYDPDPLPEFGDDAPPRTWSTEMLYRSWPTMLDIAGLPFDDWWDLPYEKLIVCKSGQQRADASVHADRQSPQGTAGAQRAARAVLKRFFSDFESILDGKRGDGLQGVAREMIADENWILVPPGSFMMGSPESKQGFPSKVKAYWIKILDELQTGQVCADEAAVRCTKEEWFTGAQGARLRQSDIEWLTEVFRALEPAPGSPAPNATNPNAPEYQAALTALERKWSRKDETPTENPQVIAAFTIHRYPILHRWFWLFAPGHRDAVEADLGATPHPDDDHPVIYISWYDAWAFCQWATWIGHAANSPTSRRRYGLYLPHEPQWEYGARWRMDGAGKAVPTLCGDSYWWGDTFYQDPDSPVEEPLSEPFVHAIGTPGLTRSPLKSTPNGLGFHDILGNVWEWTANIYDVRKEEETAGIETMHYSRKYPSSRPPVNCPRTMRGGLWYYLDVLATCTARFRLSCDDRDYKMGFRVVREERWLP